MKVIVYSKDNCIFCEKAISLATMKGLDLEVKKLGKDFGMEDLMGQFPTARTFPQIVVDDKSIGGYTEFAELKDLVKNLAFDKAVINLATPSSIQFPHTHGDSTVITYYINPEWKKEYYGETIFYDDSMQHCVGTALYEPNAAVVFDGHIPHSIRPASHIAPSYRFSLSVFFRKRNFLEEAKNNT